MEKEVFLKVVYKFILPLFTGSFLNGEEESSSRDSEVAFGKNNSLLLIKPEKTSDYRLILKRSRPFKSFELDLLKIIIREFVAINGMQILDKSYVSVLQNKAIEKAICESLSFSTSETMLGVITELEVWANRTYEGKKTTFGIIINQNDTDEENNAIHYSSLLNKDFMALLSDGKNSYLEFDREGFLMGFVTLGKARTAITTTPNDFEYIARYCNERRIGISLTENGDLLIFRNRTLMFAKRRGRWNVYCHEEIIQLLSAKNSHTVKDIRRAIYLTALDCSFAYTGGILVCLNKDSLKKSLRYVDARDLLSEKYYGLKKEIELEESQKIYNLATAHETKKYFAHEYETFLIFNKVVKTNVLRKIIDGKKFHELGRKMREELVAMDGACIIDYDGTIIAAGAILKIEAGSNQGGRLAAAKNLGKYGVSLKISQDGQISGFCKEKKFDKPKTLFTVS